jgi:hypothetical protein
MKRGEGRSERPGGGRCSGPAGTHLMLGGAGAAILLGAATGRVDRRREDWTDCGCEPVVSLWLHLGPRL